MTRSAPSEQLLLLGFLVPAVLGVNQSVSVLPVPPRSFEGYVVADSQRFANKALGAFYHFAKPNEPSIDVFVYPRDTSVVSSPLTGREPEVKVQIDQFMATLPTLHRLGYLQDYRIMSVAADSVRVGGIWDIGQAAAVDMSRQGAEAISLCYVHALGEGFIKIRVDLPAATWTASAAPSWIHHLIAQMERISLTG